MAVNLVQAALQNIESQAQRARANVLAAEDDIYRFGKLCAVLREHALDFTEDVRAYAEFVSFSITMEDEQTKLAGEMLLTLSALDCNCDSISPITDTGGYRQVFRIISEHAPNFNLYIRREHQHAKQAAIAA